MLIQKVKTIKASLHTQHDLKNMFSNFQIKHWSKGIKSGMNGLKGDDAKCDSDVLVNKHVLQ